MSEKENENNGKRLLGFDIPINRIFQQQTVGTHAVTLPFRFSKLYNELHYIFSIWQHKSLFDGL